MNLPLKERITLLTKLGNYIGSQKIEWLNIKEKATLYNSWFIPEFVEAAMDEIRSRFLDAEKLQQWIAGYPIPETGAGEEKVGVVMAGNLPAVGFHDLLCGFVSGRKMVLKVSSKDKILIPHFIDKLIEWEPLVNEYLTTADMLRDCDAYIATGSNNSARYFKQYFGRYPHIIRRNRTSVAILDGQETPEELEKLADDFLLYFGRGCRNVTKVFVPEGYDFVPVLEAMNKYRFLKDFHHYKNNFDYQLSLLLLNREYYMTNDIVLLRSAETPFSPVGVVNYEYYKDIGDLNASIQGNDDLQCVVGHGYLPFGKTQQPELDDYADGVDTLQFLTSLRL